MNENFTDKIGWIGTIIAVTMFFSYIDQIYLNMTGHYGSILVPTMLVLNCSVWVLYGSLKSKKDWPMIIANSVGIFFGIVTVITAIYGKYFFG